MNPKKFIKKEYGLNISRDSSDPKKYWVSDLLSASGSGTIEDPHVHDTYCVDEDGNIVDGHTTVVVNGRKIHLKWNLK